MACDGASPAAPEVAAYVDRDGHVGHPLDEGRVIVFRREPAAWSPVAILPQPFSADMGPEELRSRAEGLVRRLGACRSLLVSRTNGLACAMLHVHGIALWRAQGVCDPALFDRMVEPGRCRPAPDAAAGPPEPVRQPDGSWSIDISDAHERGYATRDAVLPLLRRTPFPGATILCRRRPCWLAGALDQLGLAIAGESLVAGDARTRISIAAAPPR